MAKQTGESKIDSVLGETLSSPIVFTYDYETFDTVHAAREAGEWPNDAEILKVVNATRQRNAMSAARASKSAEKVAEVKNSDSYKRGEAVKALVALGMSQEQATAIIASQA